MKFFFLIVAALLIAGNNFAQETNAPAFQKIGAIDTTNFYGKEMIVTGSVAQVSIRSSIVFLNLDHPYPDSPFTLVIHSSATNQFGNLKALKGMSIEARGKITNYHDRPEMVLQKANQLKVTGVAPTNSPSVSQ
jgi:DNA/RNA endonuclease YhcR with UshA esterase domain